MKKSLLSILFISFFNLYSHAQPIAIPNSNFENKLIQLGIDSDGIINGQILRSDAIGVTSLNLDGSGISDLTGIAAFSNLTSLSCARNQLTSLDISSNPNLDILYCYDNRLTSLDLSSNPRLTQLDCYINQLTSLDLSSNTNLTQLDCPINQLTSLDLSSNTRLTSLVFARNQLTSIDLSSNPRLTYLNCGRTQLTSLDISSNPRLTELYCHSNQLTSLDLSSNPNLTQLACGGNQLTSLELSNNPLLRALNFQSNYLSYINLKNNSALNTFNALHNLHNLIICVNDSIAVSNNSNWLKDLSAAYIEMCPNTTLVGSVQFDHNNNCQVDSLEQIVKEAIVQISGSNSTTYKVSNTLGRYTTELDSGSYTLSIAPPNPYLSPCLTPQTTTIHSLNDLDTVNWPLEITHYCPYLEASISAPFLRMTGGGSTYTINYCNNGTAPAYDAYIEVTLDPFLNVLGTGLPISNQVGNVYTFDLDTINIGECGSFNINVIISPTAQIGQVHCSKVHIYPDSLCNNTWTGSILEAEGVCVNDTITFTLRNVGSAMAAPRDYLIFENNTILSTTPFFLGAGDSITIQVPAQAGKSYRIQAPQEPGFPPVLGAHIAYANIERCNGPSTDLRTILRQYNGDPSPWVDIDCQAGVFAYDPNDKKAQQIGYGSQHYIERGTPLDYKVRFQNTGNDTAFHIAIFDTISPHLDLSTLQMKAASHHYTWQIVDERTLRIDFPNIKLVDSIANEPLSHGFFRYEIQQEPNLPLGTIINNQAAIYFDYNPPIFTNTTLHTIGENVISTNLLPVDWLYFEGTTDNKVNFLTWGTETEDNTAHFNIQRSRDGFNFQKIGQVQAQGQSIQNTHYTFNDVHPFEGANYYRLELVDIDGTLTYSNIILLNIGQTDLVYNFFPNPTDGILYYQYQAEKAEALEIKVVNVLGKLMEQKEHQTVMGINNILTDLTLYPSGTYIIRVHHKATGHIHTTKVIKHKS